MRVLPRRAYAIIRKKDRVLLVRNRRGRWTLPGGRAGHDEKLRAAAEREVAEELGIRVKTGKRITADHIRHHRLPCGRCVAFEARIKDGDPRPQDEIVEYAWVKAAKAHKRLEAFRRKKIKAVFSGKR